MNPSPVTNSARRAFLLRNHVSPPQAARVALTGQCFANNGVYCDSCRDTCESGALRFMLQRGAVPKPILDSSLCTQCGACAAVCPQSAIRVQPKTVAHG
jgi:ferredoxin-type protein NapF